MTRGTENTPKHFDAGDECEIVVYEQSKHRDASRANGAGYAQGRGGAHSWQSHHLICISAMGDRKTKDDETTILLEKSLYLTKWNINDAPNMIGLPMYRLYIKRYDTDMAGLPATARDAAFAAVVPQSIPAHDIDHNTAGGFTDEVRDYLKTNIWNKFSSDAKDHKKDAEWLADKLKSASQTFQSWLLSERGTRESGTVAAWKNRFSLVTWADPFSMARMPTERYPGKSHSDLTDIFDDL